MACEDITLVWREFEPMSLATPALAGGFFTTSATWEAPWREKLAQKHCYLPKTLWVMSDEVST